MSKGYGETEKKKQIQRKEGKGEYISAPFEDHGRELTLMTDSRHGEAGELARWGPLRSPALGRFAADSAPLAPPVRDGKGRLGGCPVSTALGGALPPLTPRGSVAVRVSLSHRQFKQARRKRVGGEEILPFSERQRPRYLGSITTNSTQCMMRFSKSAKCEILF
jgi:hypothetical protein